MLLIAQLSETITTTKLDEQKMSRILNQLNSSPNGKFFLKKSRLNVFMIFFISSDHLSL